MALKDLNMKYYSYFLFFIFLFFSACTGVDSRINQSFKNSGNTIALKDLTARDYRMMDAGSLLEEALEDTLSRSIFVVTSESPKYIIKYKVLKYHKGSRLGRFATFGLSSSAQGRLEVKVALYDEGERVGAWIVDAWVKGGLLGGSPNKLFQKAADEIMGHLRGDF